MKKLKIMKNEQCNFQQQVRHQKVQTFFETHLRIQINSGQTNIDK